MYVRVLSARDRHQIASKQKIQQDSNWLTFQRRNCFGEFNGFRRCFSNFISRWQRFCTILLRLRSPILCRFLRGPRESSACQNNYLQREIQTNILSPTFVNSTLPTRGIATLAYRNYLQFNYECLRLSIFVVVVLLVGDTTYNSNYCRRKYFTTGHAQDVFISAVHEYT